MTALSTIHFNNTECLALQNQHYRLLASISGGPRILWFGLLGGENLFVELENFCIPTAAGDYHLRGGHRLWNAPEDPASTYLPDNEAVQVQEYRTDFLSLLQLPQSNGLRKSLQIQLLENGIVRVTHSLQNLSAVPVRLSAWAITIMRPGGTAYLPHPQGNTDEHGLLPNRSFVFWPYSDIASQQFRVGNAYSRLQTGFAEGECFKVGWHNPVGWLAYQWQNQAFIKRAKYLSGSDYPDLNCNAEIFARREFLELETLSPLVTLSANESVQHVEEWQILQVENGKDSWQALSQHLMAE